MLLKLLLKIWPSFIPIFSYFFWIVVQNMVSNYLRRKNYIEGEFEEVDEKGNKVRKPTSEAKIKPNHFSLQNKKFILVIYLSLILLIISFLFLSLESPTKNGNYIPAKNINGKIIPARIE